MKSEDDPEARIRELEQPLAETARVSEIGQSPNNWAPPSGPSVPPPLPHGHSFPYPSAKTLRQSRARWIMLAVFIIAMIVLPAMIFHLGARHAPRNGSSATYSAPGVASPNPGRSREASPGTASAAAPTPPPSSVPAGQSVTISGISASRTIACDGGKVSVSGITNTVTITGHCASVSVSGIQNQVTVDAADTIGASGSGNHVTYHSGSPTIAKAGSDNVVENG